MRRPKRSDFTDDDGTVDYDALEEKLCEYEDEEYDRWCDAQISQGEYEPDESDKLKEEAKDDDNDNQE